MTAPILHYLYDPLCGWCYGAAPLLRAARDVLPVRPRSGGMMAGARRQAVTPQLRAYVQPHDQRIAQLSGQPFGPAYTDGLLRDNGAVFDSEPPTAAMLAAEQLAGRGLDMLARLQVAHYEEGRRIAEPSVLVELAASLGLDAAAFAETLTQLSGEAVQAHFRETREFMTRVGARGFPTFVLETAEGLQSIDVSAYLGRPQAFQERLRQRAGLPAGSAAQAPGCGFDGCAL